ncbi:MAG: SDR family oxidoreductase [Gammaproteobacteria bacterium]|nr:SDR family oxidoreductase [Gammaproteobacteria bacterium]
MKLIIFGCGYLGSRLAQWRLQKGDEVVGIVRSGGSVERLQELAIVPLRADLDSDALPSIPLRDASVFYFAPPPREGEEDSRLRRLIAAFERQDSPRRLVYLSTTGVYGDCAGEWVDEKHPVNPVVPRAMRRWDAEQVLQQWRQRTGGELVILRVAGIYGPGKLPLDRLKRGVPMVQASEAPFTNRIHIDDLVQACSAAMDRGRDGEVYNLSDGQPGTMTDYFNQIADLAGLPRPPQIFLAEGEGQLSAGMMSYMRESRRLDNRKMLQELGVELKYPTLEQGLKAIL